MRIKKERIICMVKTDKRSTKYYIGSAIAILIMFFFGKIVPTWGSVAEVGVSVIGVFIGVIVAIFVTGDTLWPSIVAMAALTVHGYFPNFNKAISSVFGIGVVYGFFLITAMINCMNDAGTGESIASILLTRKMFQKKPLLLSYCFLMTFSIATNFMNTIGTMLLGFPILDSMLRTANVKPDTKYARFMNLGLFMAIALGFTYRSVVMPDINFRFEYFTKALEGTGVVVDYGFYTIFIILSGFTFFALYVLAMKYVFKCDFGGLTNLDFTTMPEIVNKAKMDKYQLTFIGAFAVFALSGLAPKSWTAVKAMGQYGILGLLCVALFFMKRKDKDGNVVMMFDLGKYLKTVPWSVALSLGIFSAIGSALGSDDCGIKQWLVDTVGEILKEGGSFSLVLICIVGCAALTHVFNNAATMTIFSALVAPLAAPFIADGSLDAALLMAAIVMCAQSGCLTMAASATAPILHTREGINNKFMFTGGLFMNALFIMTMLGMYLLFTTVL